MSRMYAKKMSVQEATIKFTEQLRGRLDRGSADFRVRKSYDSQSPASHRGEYIPANSASVSSLNHQVREPETLILYEWGVYECTVNDTNDKYNQSTLAILKDVPEQETVDTFAPFKVWIAPPNTQYVDFLMNDDEQRAMPTREELIELEWTEVTMKVAPEREITARYGRKARRKQYAMRHVGALTINKSQGDIIPTGLAVEISETCSPWQKEQLVVFSSRTKWARDMIIVGDKEFAVNKMWDLATTANQWTEIMESILNMVTINSDGSTEFNPRYSLNYTHNYPYQLSNLALPSDSTGYVYILISLRNKNFTYIGQTQNIRQRLRNHNLGHGAFGTSSPEDRPFAVAGLICGLGHKNVRYREYLERQWKDFRDNALDVDDPMSIINIGNRLVEHENSLTLRAGNIEILRYLNL